MGILYYSCNFSINLKLVQNVEVYYCSCAAGKMASKWLIQVSSLGEGVFIKANGQIIVQLDTQKSSFQPPDSCPSLSCVDRWFPRLRLNPIKVHQELVRAFYQECPFLPKEGYQLHQKLCPRPGFGTIFLLYCKWSTHTSTDSVLGVVGEANMRGHRL